MQEVTNLLNKTVKGLQIHEPMLAKALKKWLPFVKHSVSDLVRITKKDPVDITQDLLVAVVEAHVSYGAKLFRYNKKLYEIDMYDGKVARLVTPKYKKTKKLECFWVMYRQVVPVRKSSLDSYLYQVISQQYLDMLTLYFTQRNGWQRVGPRKSKIRKVERIGQEVLECNFNTGDSDVFRNLFIDSQSGSGEIIEAREFLERMFVRISSNALIVLKELLEDPHGTVADLSKCCGLSRNCVYLCKKQIKQAAIDLTTLQPFYFQKIEPVHLTR